MSKVVSLEFRRQARAKFHEDLNAAVKFDACTDKYAEVSDYLIARDKAMIVASIQNLKSRIGYEATLQFVRATLQETFK